MNIIIAIIFNLLPNNKPVNICNELNNKAKIINIQNIILDNENDNDNKKKNKHKN